MPIDRRQELRRATEGRVTLRIPGKAAQVEGRLIDLSAHGFRVRHLETTLESRTVVEYTAPFGRGKAVVAWNRIEAGQVESGFTVSPPARPTVPAAL
ncbi:MAG: PilZ domain-containing protein [Acidobacteria bacterium]|nr:PilZ domain-containing protein [Acidobacteriota bacterium]